MSDLSADPYAEAAEKGLIVVLPGDRELQIDIDDAESERRLNATLLTFKDNGFVFVEMKRTVSPGGNTHVTLETPLAFSPMTPTLRVALQACFGSDRTRESLSLLRIYTTERIPTLFFERAS